MAFDEQELVALPIRPYQLLLEVIHKSNFLNYMQLHRPLSLSLHPLWMLLLEDLRRYLAEVDYLRLAALTVDIISSISETVAVVLVRKVVVDVEVIRGSWAALLHSE